VNHYHLAATSVHSSRSLPPPSPKVPSNKPGRREREPLGPRVRPPGPRRRVPGQGPVDARHDGVVGRANHRPGPLRHVPRRHGRRRGDQHDLRRAAARGVRWRGRRAGAAGRGDPRRVDNGYFRALVEHRGLLHSDQELFNSGSQDALVRRYAHDGAAFAADFAKAMVRMGNLVPAPGTPLEVRVNRPPTRLLRFSYSEAS
jgi:hypothetical protein